MPRYGFKANNAEDRQAITNLMLQQGQILHRQYDTLAQYEIKDVQLKPTNLGLGRPRRWTLTFNTNLVGMNMPDGEALWFAKEDREVGDGYSTLDLNVDQFTKMLKGGLYVDPSRYMKKLKKQLNSQTFYRPTKANLMTIDVPGDVLNISAGDFSGKMSATHRYLVGADLQGYSNVDSTQKTNLIQLVNSKVDDLSKQPITEIAELKVPNDLSLASDEVKASLLTPQDRQRTETQADVARQLREQMRAFSHLYPDITTTTQNPTTVNATLFDDSKSQSNNAQTSQNIKRSNAIRQEQQEVSNSDGLKTPEEFHESVDSGVQFEQRPAQLDTDQADQFNGQSPVGQNANEPQNFADLMASLQSQANQGQPISNMPQRAYVDDFAQAAQESHQNLNKKRQRTAQNEAALDEKNKQSNNSGTHSSDPDDDLSL